MHVSSPCDQGSGFLYMTGHIFQMVEKVVFFFRLQTTSRMSISTSSTASSGSLIRTTTSWLMHRTSLDTQTTVSSWWCPFLHIMWLGMMLLSVVVYRELCTVWCFFFFDWWNHNTRWPACLPHHCSPHSEDHWESDVWRGQQVSDCTQQLIQWASYLYWLWDTIVTTNNE